MMKVKAVMDMRISAGRSAGGKCIQCGGETVTPRSSYCREHFEELLKKKARED